MRKLINPIAIAGATVLFALLMNACATKKEVNSKSEASVSAPKNPFTPENPVESKVIFVGDTALMQAGYEVQASYFSGDTLHMRMSYKGGCGFSDYYLRKIKEDSATEVYKLFRTSDDWCQEPKQIDIYFIVKATTGKKLEIYSDVKRLH